MSENPLLSHAELRALLALTRRVAALEAACARKSSAPARRGTTTLHAGREAVLAATTLQLQPGDLLIPAPGDVTASELRPQNPAKPGDAADRARKAPVFPPEHTKGVSRLLLAAAMASALRDAGTDHIALVLMQAGVADAGWQAALTWSQESLLPLLLVCTDHSGAEAFTRGPKISPAQLGWSGVSRLAARQKVPVLTVDGEDAVALYRTVQEAILRARSGGGPAVLWAALPTAAESDSRSRTQRPVARLAQYLRARGIPLA